PRFVNTAITSRVSTRTSRSAASVTSAPADGGGASADCAVASAGATDAGLAPGGGDADMAAAGAFGAWPAAVGFGTGFTNSACQVYRTRKARKIARRTRRSIYEGTGSCPAAHNGWQRIRRRAASQVPRCTPWRSIAIAAYSEHDGRKRQEPVK